MVFLKFNKFIMFLLIVNLIIANVFTVYSKEKLTPYKIVAGTTLNGNFYFSDFTELNGYPSCCTKYDFASGIGYSLFIGGEYITGNKILGLPYSIDLLFSYNNFSAKYAIEEKLANIITGNNYIEAFSEHSLDAKIYSFLLEPGINLFAFKEIPLNIRLGFKIGVLTGLTFVQEERILSPDWITYKETGTKLKYHYEGNIPDVSKMYSAISLGLRYEAIKSGAYSISPVINFNYGLSNVISGFDWKIASIQGGLSLGYNIPEQKDIPPKEAPLPMLPKPPMPKQIIVELGIEANNQKLLDNDTLHIPVKERKFINRFILIPFVFYEVNTDKMLVSDNTLRSEEEAQKNAYLSAIQYIKNKPDVDLTLFSSGLNTEEPEIIKKRIDKMYDLILKEGITRNRIKTKEVIVDAAKLSKEELYQDNCFIRFDFSDGTEIISYRSDTVTKLIFEPVEIIINPKVHSEIKLSEFKGYASIGSEVKHIFGNETNSFELKSDSLDFYKNQMKFFTKVVDSIGTGKSINLSLNLKPEIKNDGIFENVISDFEQTNYVRQFTLAYCEFDKAEFSFVNKLAVDEIKKAYNSGEMIEIIPLFDFLGTEEHNLKLATSRANSALNLLGINKDNVKINIPKDYFFSNNNPYGRMMNRTVIVRIKNISGN
ncbi:MAG: hypothetical protein V1779_15120 [bacterium]